MRYCLTCLTLSLLLYASAAAALDNPLTPFHAEYTVTEGKKTVGHSSLQLTDMGQGRWRYQSRLEPTGLLASLLNLTIEEQSDWRWADGVQTLEYRYNRSQTGKKKQVHLVFDWQQMMVTNTIDGDAWQMSINDATQDKLSVHLALTAHLSTTQTDVSFIVADGGKLKTYDFKIIGEETLSTALGNIDTIKVSRNKRGRKHRQTTLWLAPTLNYLPLRIERQDNGRLLTLHIETLHQSSEKDHVEAE